MRFRQPGRGRLLAVVAVVAAAVVTPVVTGPPAGAATTPLTISVSSNHFVDGAGHTVRLLGVDRPSAEYACVDGFAYDDGHFDLPDATAIAAWGADAVRVPLNEDCWLGINGQPNSDEGADPPLTVAGYRLAIQTYVTALHRRGLYAILDLQWSAPGGQVALEQQPMPDLDHAPAFWTSVATTFRADRAVVFDLFGAPYDPTDPRSGTDPVTSDRVTWNCWQTGTQRGPAGGAPCLTSAYDENNSPTTTYQVAGLQTLLDAVRGTGAKQPVLAGGLDHANDLGESNHGSSWLTHIPVDPLHQVAASFHTYMGKRCAVATCWQQTVAPVAAQVPVVTGEFAENDFDQPNCAVHTPNTFDARYMKWADTAGVSYLAWGWFVETAGEQDADGCAAFPLIQDYTTHRPAAPNGVAVHTHLRALQAAAA